MRLLDRDLRIEVLATGNELLDGSISDKHSQSIGAYLRSLGLRLARTTIVGDDAPLIRQQLVEIGARSDVVIVTGGLGPTVDDLTLEVAAKAFGSTLVKDSQATKNVLALVKRHRRKLNPGHKKMMLIPRGSKALWNNEGTAPGVRWDVGDRTYFFLPGVPKEFHFCFHEHLAPFFKKYAPKMGRHLIVAKVVGWPESLLDQLCKKIAWPEDVDVGFRTSLPENHIKLLIPARSRAEAFKKISKPYGILKKKLGQALFTDTDESFAEVFVQDLKKKRVVLGAAESCTGGLLSSLVTSVSGSSAVFDRGFIVYSNQAKIDLLGVREGTLKKHGAVSEECILELLDGVLSRSPATAALAISGIAGPTGGTRAKPVGTIWIGAALGKKRRTKLLQLAFQREQNQKAATYVAMNLLRELLYESR